MKTKKNGDVAISRFVWETQAETHHETANELDKVIREYQTIANLGLSAIEEGKVIESGIALAFFDLLVELRNIQIAHLKLALGSKKLASKTRRGPPVIKPKYTQYKLWSIATGRPYKAKRKPGRPTKNGVDGDLQTYRVVEQRRELLAASHGRATIKAAIESLIKQDANNQGKSFLHARSDDFNKIKSRYNRGKKRLDDDQN